MSCNIRLRGSSECSPKEWESFEGYMKEKFAEIQEYCQLDIMKGIMVMGKEDERLKVISELESQFNIYTEEDIFTDI